MIGIHSADHIEESRSSFLVFQELISMAFENLRDVIIRIELLCDIACNAYQFLGAQVMVFHQNIQIYSGYIIAANMAQLLQNSIDTTGFVESFYSSFGTHACGADYLQQHIGEKILTLFAPILTGSAYSIFVVNGSICIRLCQNFSSVSKSGFPNK